jgi:hypothetical protein
VNGVRQFLNKYHAVPANDAGPSWSQASEAALLGWFQTYASVVRCGWHREAQRAAVAVERGAMWPVCDQIVNEIARRARRPDASPDILAAWYRARLPEES